MMGAQSVGVGPWRHVGFAVLLQNGLKYLKFSLKTNQTKQTNPQPNPKCQEDLDTLSLVLITRDVAPDLEDLGEKNKNLLVLSNCLPGFSVLPYKVSGALPLSQGDAPGCI